MPFGILWCVAMPVISSSPSSTGSLHQVHQLLEKKVSNISPIVDINCLVMKEGAKAANVKIR